MYLIAEANTGVHFNNKFSYTNLVGFGFQKWTNETELFNKRLLLLPACTLEHIASVNVPEQMIRYTTLYIQLAWKH